MQRQDLLKKKLPDASGVYFFLGARKKILYIGRATSLRNRVRSYFSGDIRESRGPWIAKMLPLIESIDFRKTDSVLEAILLEAELIKTFQPTYNTDEKDDKSFNCVVITKEDFPAVLIERSKNVNFKGLKLTTLNLQLQTIYGPYPAGFHLQTALKIIRRIFPYRDLKCAPSSVGVKLPQACGSLTPTTPTPLVRGKPCFNRQIGLCPGVCTGEITVEAYKKQIQRLCLFLSGKRATVIRELKRDMKVAAKTQEFERAGELKRQLFALTHIQDVALLRRTTNYLPAPQTSRQAGELRTTNYRIEAYDVSHFGGKEIVGAMAAVEDGIARPSEYRLFKLRGLTGPHEIAGLQEILRRRLAHPEWTLPHLIVVDGNEVQKRAAEAVLTESGLAIPVMAVVKNERHRPERVIAETKVLKRHKSDILLANAEAHRFVRAFHRKKLRGRLLHP